MQTAAAMAQGPNPRYPPAHSDEVISGVIPMGRATPACLLLLGTFLLAGPPARAQPVACPTDARVVAVQRADRGLEGPLPDTGAQLSNIIRVRVTRLPELLACAGTDPFVLFLGRRPFATLVPVGHGDDFLDFEFEVRPPARGSDPDPWPMVLGRPFATDSAIPISVGLLGQAAIASDVNLVVDRVPRNWFLLWGSIFVGLLGLFWYCLHYTTILRDPSVDPGVPPMESTYSLARTQAAWWFFFILASYLLIGIVTGDFFGSLNGTALALLSIGAGTAVLGSAIDVSSAEKESADRQVALQVKRGELAPVEAEVASLDAQVTAATEALARLRQADPPDLQAIVAQASEGARLAARSRDAIARKAALETQIVKLTGRCEGFFRDIVSDMNGASFSRFQMIAWTLVLTVVFLRGVYVELAMPTFDPTLLGLMGLSAATYLGMKTNEPVAPPAPG
jgi:hypothetical protein